MLFHTDKPETYREANPAITSAMSRELHHVAQPLTVLQGTLEIALIKERSQAEYQSILHKVMEHSQKLADCFARVQRLAHFQQPATDIAEFSAAAMVRSVLETVESHFIARGINSEFHPTTEGDAYCDMVRASEKRVTAALELVLSSLANAMPPHSKTVLLMDVKSQSVLLTLSIQQSLRDLVLGSGLIADLELAEAIASSAGAKLTCSPATSCIMLGLTKALPALSLHNSETLGYSHV